MKITLCMLNLNDLEGMKSVIDRIPEAEVDEFFVVDGGSTDGSIEFLEERGVTVYKQKTPGRGDAFREAFKVARGDALIFFSSDGNEDPSDIPTFRSYLESGHDLIIATRMAMGGHNEEDDQLLKPRKWVNQLFTLGANVLWNRSGTYVTDTINGYRCITQRAWELLKLDGPGYTVEYQSSIRAFKLRLKIAEFATYEGERVGHGGAPSIPTGILFVRLFLREMWLSVRGVLGWKAQANV